MVLAFRIFVLKKIVILQIFIAKKVLRVMEMELAYIERKIPFLPVRYRQGFEELLMAFKYDHVQFRTDLRIACAMFATL